MEHTFTVKYRFTMEWYDPRLVYHNLKTRRSSNSLGIEDVDRLWIPVVVFRNTENSEATLGEVNSEVTVTREGEFTRSGAEVVEEINIFRGAANKITFQQVYTKTFKCKYLLHLYPFDTQVCDDAW